MRFAPRSLRAKVVLAASLAIVASIAGLGIAASILVESQLRSSLDRTLRERAAEVSRLSASAPALLTRPGSLEASLGGRQILVQVVDRRGRIVARSLGLGGQVLAAGRLVDGAIRDGAPGYGDARLGGDSLRLYVAPLPEVGGAAAGGAVIVASTTSDIDTTLGRVRRLVILAALIAAALGALAVAVLMRRALRPLERLSQAAGEIERTRDSKLRLPEPASGDEVGSLAETLNRMLGALDQAREAERRFVADASHELRTPLTVLRGNVAYLAKHGADPLLVEELQGDVERLTRLASDLLALSREAASEALDEPVALDELAREAAAPDVAVVAPASVPVRGDRAALERALANLVANARVHGPAGGRITVTAEAADGLARLSVEDEGAGLSPADAELAFAPFWRGGHDREGSGLGLAIVRATAERHGGRAYAQGARFAIELPLLRELSRSPATTEGASEKGTP